MTRRVALISLSVLLAFLLLAMVTACSSDRLDQDVTVPAGSQPVIADLEATP